MWTVGTSAATWSSPCHDQARGFPSNKRIDADDPRQSSRLNLGACVSAVCGSRATTLAPPLVSGTPSTFRTVPFVRPCENRWQPPVRSPHAHRPALHEHPAPR